MLNESDRELLAAAVDGSLTPISDAAFRKLLAESSDAVAFYQQLQRHAQQLREARRYSAPASLAPAVMARVQSLPRPVIYPTRPPVAERRSSWLPYVVASSVMTAVAAGSFWFVVNDRHETEAFTQNQSLPAAPDTTPRRVNPTPIVPRNSPSNAANDSTQEAGSNSPTTEIARNVPTPEAAPTPREYGAGNLIAFPPVADVKPFDAVQVRLPLLVAVADLNREDARDALRAELARDPAFRIDLFAKDVGKAADHFQSVAKSAGVNLTTDAATRDRMQKKLLTALAVYSEALTADDLVQLLVQLAKAGEKSQPFTAAHVVPAQATEQRELRELLGVDPGLFKRPKAGPKAISADTGNQIAAAMLKGKPADKPAVLVSYLPSGARSAPATSKEIKSFLDRREERKATAVPVMIVIRPAS